MAETTGLEGTSAAVAVDPTHLSRGLWEFGIVGEPPLSIELDLRPDGSIAGCDHVHQRYWAYSNGAIKFYNRDRILSLKFTRSDPGDDDGPWELFEAPFLLYGLSDRHFLRRRKATLGAFLRTHFWDEGAAAAHGSLSGAIGQQAFVAADVTSQYTLPSPLRVAPHSLADFARYGLSLHPSMQRAMWYNGDHVLYHLFLNYDFSHFIVAEYDMGLQLDFHAVCRDLVEQSYDFAAFDTGVAFDGWIWDPVHRAWDAFEAAATGNVKELSPIYKSFFPLVFISRRAIAHLFARRLTLSRLYRQNPEVPVPYCESFVPTELVRAGFKIGNLSAIVPGAKRVIVDEPMTWLEFARSGYTCAHPVLGGLRFVDKLIYYAAIVFGPDIGRRIEWLSMQSSRLETPEQSAHLQARMHALSQ